MFNREGNYKMKRKIIFVLTALLICLFSLSAVAIFTGCNCNGKNPDPDDEKTCKLRIVDAPDTLKVGSLKKLIYLLPNGEDYSKIVFESGNPSVATIDNNGNVEAIKPGQTVISGKYEEGKVEFTLNVIKDDTLPQLLFYNYVKESDIQIIEVGYKLNLSNYVFYNGRSFTDAQVDYSIDNKDIVFVENGVVTAKKQGDATITISANWRDFESPLLKKEIKIKVINESQILLEDGAATDITLYTVGSLDGKTYATSYDLAQKVRFIYNGKDLTASVTYSLENNKSDKDASVQAVSIDGNVLTAETYGSAKLVANAVDNGETVTGFVDVKIVRPVATRSETMYFSQVDNQIIKNDGTILDVVAFLGENVVQAYKNGNNSVGTPLTVENGNVSVIDDVQVREDCYLTLYTEKCGLALNVKAAYKVINELEDLNSLSLQTLPPVGGSRVYTKGYFLVSNDIKWDGKYYAKPAFRWYEVAGASFDGTLDGDGHTVEFGVSQGGLFGESALGTVKNISLIVKKVENVWSGDGMDSGDACNVILARRLYQMNIENVYAAYDIENFIPNVSSQGGGWAFLGFGGNTYGPNYKNVVLDLTKVKGVEDKVALGGVNAVYGVLYYDYNQDLYPCTANNVHVIWNVKNLGAFNNNVAENDNVAGANKMIGVIRHENYGSIKSYFDDNPDFLALFASCVDTELGFPYGMEDENHLVKNAISATVNGESGEKVIFDEGKSGEVYLGISFLGESQSVTLSHFSGDKIVTIQGSKIIYGGEYGAEKIQISATINGVKIELFVSVIVRSDLDLENLGEIIYDGEGDLPAVFGDSLKSYVITAIISKEDPTVTLYDGSVWNIERNETNEIITVKGIAYSGDKMIGLVDINMVYKIISKPEDLFSVQALGGVKIVKGYFLVVNDIDATGIEIRVPYGNAAALEGCFEGNFDGGGHTITFNLNPGGIFGQMRSGIVKNASFIVKSVGGPEKDSYEDIGKYAVLANYAQYMSLDNVYVKYDCEFTATNRIPSQGHTRGLGFFQFYFDWENPNARYMTNIILDLSKVTMVADETYHQYGVICAPFANGIQGTKEAYIYPSSMGNIHIIWGNKLLSSQVRNGELLHVAYASNDTYEKVGSEIAIQLNGVYRYDTYVEFASEISKVGNFRITADGVVWNDEIN